MPRRLFLLYYNYLFLFIIVLGTVCIVAVPRPAGAADETTLPGTAAEESVDDVADDDVEGVDDFESFEEFEEDSTQTVFDPLSGYNRVMTRVNDRLYYWVLKPVARGYRAVVAETARKGISNFFRNLGFPLRAVNNLLQLKFKRAGTETARFVVNTTVGVAGLWDAASDWLEMPIYPEDFGQTLGHYGLGSGFHLVLPLLGPSNARDVCGKVADWFLDPVNYIEDPQVETAVTVLDVVNETSLRIGQYEAITRDSLDMYILLRDGYQNRRNKAIEE